MIPIVVFAGFLLTVLIGAYRQPAVVLVATVNIFAIKGWLVAESSLFAAIPLLPNYIYGVIVAMIAMLCWRSLLAGVRHIHAAWIASVLIYFYAYVSTLWTPQPEEAQILWLNAYPYVLINVLVLPLLLQRAEWNHFAKFQLFWGAIFATIFLFFGEWGTRGLLVGAEQTNPLEIAQLGAITCICAIYCSGKLNFASVTIRSAVFVLSTFLILKTGSRGQLFGMLLAILCVWLISNKMLSFRIQVFLFGFVLLSALLVSVGVEFFWNEINPERYSSEIMIRDLLDRFSMAGQLLQGWLDDGVSVIFGLGNSASFDPEIIGVYPHFLPIEILGEEGFIGATLYLVVVILAVTHLLSTARSVRNSKSNDRRKDDFRLIGSMWIYLFLLTLKQGSLLGHTLFFSVSTILVAQSLLKVSARKVTLSNSSHNRFQKA